MDRPDWLKSIRAVIRERKIKQEALTESFSVSSPGAVSHYLTGKRELSVDKFLSLCEFLNLSPNQLLGTEAKLDPVHVEKVVKEVVETWMIRLEQMAWLEYKNDQKSIIDVLSKSIADEIIKK